jgi:hypothetical protein
VRAEGQCGGSKGTLTSNSKIVCARTRVRACVCVLLLALGFTVLWDVLCLLGFSHFYVCCCFEVLKEKVIKFCKVN